MPPSITAEPWGWVLWALWGRSLGLLLHPSPVDVQAPDIGTAWGCQHGPSHDGSPWLWGGLFPTLLPLAGAAGSAAAGE